MSSRIKKVLLALLFIVLLYGVMALTLKAIGLENAQNWIKNAGVWAPLFFVGLCAFSLVIAPLSGSSLFVIGGTLFGKETAFLLSYIASLIGCSINFWISRRFGRPVVGRFIGKGNLEELDRFTSRLKRHHEILYIILVMPLSQDIVSYAVGLTQVHYGRFLVALTISTAIVVSLYVYLGSSLLQMIV